MYVKTYTKDRSYDLSFFYYIRIRKNQVLRPGSERYFDVFEEKIFFKI